MAKLCDHGYFLEVAPRSCPKCRTDTDLALREEIYALRATISRLESELACKPDEVLFHTDASKLRATISRLLEVSSARDFELMRLQDRVSARDTTISRLWGYIDHDPECRKNLEYDIPCDCGYDALMAEVGEK